MNNSKKGDDMGSDEVVNQGPLEFGMIPIDGKLTVDALLSMTEPLPQHLSNYIVPAPTPTAIRGCVDEREKGLMVSVDANGDFHLSLEGLGSFSFSVIEVQENEGEDRETPFPGGRVGVYYYSAVNSLLSGEAMKQDFWSTQSEDEFASSFVDYFTQLADESIAEFEKNHGLTLDLPVHIDDHSVEGVRLFNEDGDIEMQGLNKMLEEGLGCGFAKVFMSVLMAELKNRGETELAQDLTEKLGSDTSAIGETVSRRLIHQAIASGSSVEVLEHGHEFDAITYMTQVGETFDRTKSRKSSNFKTFVVNTGWVGDQDHPIYMLVKEVVPDMSDEDRETSMVAMNSITFELLGAGNALRYSS